jgi:hypothetical protein
MIVVVDDKSDFSVSSFLLITMDIRFMSLSIALSTDYY